MRIFSKLILAACLVVPGLNSCRDTPVNADSSSPIYEELSGDAKQVYFEELCIDKDRYVLFNKSYLKVYYPDRDSIAVVDSSLFPMSSYMHGRIAVMQGYDYSIADFSKNGIKYHNDKNLIWGRTFDINEKGDYIIQYDKGLDAMINNKKFEIVSVYSGTRAKFINTSQKIAYLNLDYNLGHNDSLFVYDCQNNTQEFITTINDFDGADSYRSLFSISPTENTLVGIDKSGNSVFVYNSEDKKLVNIFTSTTEKRYPVYSPDGSKIAFLELNGNKQTIGIIDKNGYNYYHLDENIWGEGEILEIKWHSPNLFLLKQVRRVVDVDIDIYERVFDMRTNKFRVLSYCMFNL
jgi:hypothetical protein